jgi:hypothetical protein
MAFLSFVPGSAGPTFLALAATACAGALLFAAPARAQFAAPGAVPPTGLSISPDSLKPDGERPRRRRAPAAAADPAFLDRTLLQNGGQSRLEVERRDGGLVAARLQLAGLASDGSGKACQVDLTASGALRLAELGGESGLPRYEVPAEGCAMSFTALNGAALMKGPGQACVFAKEACRVDVSGLWGPPAASVLKIARDIEKARSRADQAVRSHYKTLIGRAVGNEAVKTVAREQAGFSAEREMVCRPYDKEVEHGFCHARFSEARAAELAARLGVSARAEADAPRKEKRKARKRDDKPAPASAGGGATTPSLF